MNELSSLIVATLQLVLWLVIIVGGFSWLMNFLFPKARWHKGLLTKTVRFIFILPFRTLYQAGKWLVVRFLTTQPNYRFQQIYLENYPVTTLEFYAVIE